MQVIKKAYQIGLLAIISFFGSLSTLSLLKPTPAFSTTQVLAQTPDPRKAEADRLFQQANQQQLANQMEAAIQSLQKALTLYREINDRQGEGSTLLSLGSAYFSLGNYAKALEYNQQRLDLMQKISDRQGEASALGMLSNIYSILGNKAKTLEYQLQSLAITRTLGDRKQEGFALQSLGGTYTVLGDAAKAIDAYQQNLAIAQEFQDPLQTDLALSGLSMAYVNQGNYTKALEYAQQRLALIRKSSARQQEGNALLALSNIYQALGDATKAMEYRQQSLELDQKMDNSFGESTNLFIQANSYESQGNYAKSIQLYQQSLELVRKMGNSVQEGYILNALGRSLFLSGNLAQAKETLLSAIQIEESQRRGLDDSNQVSFFDNQVKSYDTLQQVLVAQNQPEAALEISERSRARAFVELLAKRLSGNSATPPTIAPLTIKQLKKIAQDQKATLVEYSLIGRNLELFTWVVKPTGEVGFHRTNLIEFLGTSSIEDLVTSSRQSIGARGRGLAVVAKVDGASQPQGTSQTQQLQQLHKLLIEPIAELLPKDPSAHVIFVPQGALFLVPFAALQDTSGQYLIEKHTILTSPAIQVLDLTHQQRQRIPGSATQKLVVGNPTMPMIGTPPQQLPSLPGAEKEALEIAKLLDTKALIGNQATKTAILAQLPLAGVIHLATHGLLDDFKGLGVPGAIALAPSGADNGLLRADEILNLKLSAELVVLSACDTGQGKITGDGVIGLSRSLISAGVPSVMVSLWSIPDAPTAFLMSEFYRNWQHHPDKGQALRLAILATMKQNPNPVNWAAFTLIGESD
ncbi:CHAT domain-containing tetratricopeptide repeat protein [Allocoleopsis sp.]|uniref:CHAT domain-containing protein n=1 Tax=Allocoleopsis sp. TaxID=3088169 RepID=UPI002FD189C2